MGFVKYIYHGLSNKLQLSGFMVSHKPLFTTTITGFKEQDMPKSNQQMRNVCLISPFIQFLYLNS